MTNNGTREFPFPHGSRKDEASGRFSLHVLSVLYSTLMLTCEKHTPFTAKTSLAEHLEKVNQGTIYQPSFM